ncbi:MAG: ribosome biogenesis GTPase Der [Gammaproteobacteria bacterium]|nr:MAG: ribosome biogenesis GTPase Der [Gammaproteobacteria bacterium]
MTPVIALVGRPNVGKSTLFNRLTRSRDALVADFPGLTRDRKYGRGRIGARDYLVVDTGGLSGEEQGMDAEMARQTRQAIEEADAILFLVDGRDGVTAADEQIAAELRSTGRPVFLVVNKTDGIDAQIAASEFWQLGLGEPIPIAAAHGRGVASLMHRVLDSLPAPEALPSSERMEQTDGREPEGDEGQEESLPDTIRIAFIGRPNVGKSTLINRLLGEERVVVYDQPGTTRDSIEIPFERDGERYVLIDTAGVRRRARIREAVEKFSIVKTLQAIESAHVVIAVLDAREGVTDQDAHLLGLAAEAGRSIVVAINKWDGLSQEQKEAIRRSIDVKLPFLDFAEIHFISALHGTGVGHLFDSVREAFRSAFIQVSTSRLTRLLEEAVATHQPPLVRGRRIKLRYAHQGGKNPPTIVIHGNQTASIPGSYQRYLRNFFRKALGIVGTPIRLEFRTGENPYAGRRNRLTPRQQKKRQRLKRHIHKQKSRR